MATNSRRGAAWQKLRLAVLERDHYICAYCGREANEADHIIPVNAGGKDEMGNLVAACKPCNGRKQDRIMARMDWYHKDWLTHI